jgi:dipeptidyl aminopeptidase/acylaminoacyl peptidase
MADHALTGIVGDPAFSADGATVAWIDGSRPTPWLDSAPSGGGPLLSVRLPLAAGDLVTDLAVAPDGGRLAYSVTHAGSSGGELRVADLSDGVTLAASAAGSGGSPNWSRTGDRLAFLGHQGGQPEIQVATVPEASADQAVRASVSAFANAQIAGDTAALVALSDHGVPVNDLPRPGRVVVVQVAAAGQDLWRASLRLVVDPSPADPVARSADETLVLRRDSGSGQFLVANASAGPLANVSGGPHVVRVGAGSQPGTLAVTYDADVDASSVRGANMVRAADGAMLPVHTAYDPSTRTVTISLPAGAGGTVKLFVTTGIRDVSGHQLAAPFQGSLTITPG